MRKHEIVVIVGILISGLILPLVLKSSLWFAVLNLFFYYAITSISWNIIFGYAGLFSFGHMAFPALGGYTSALLALHIGISPFLGLLLGGLVSGFMGVLIGLVILRVRGFYLILVSWGFAEVFNVIVKTEQQITGGTGGLLTPPFFEGLQSDLYTYFVGLGLMLLILGASAALYHSRWGLCLFAIRDDIDAAETLGIRTRFWKVFGFSFGCAWAGVAGAFYAHFITVIDPSISGVDEMGKICLMVIIGGIGTVFGPLIGSFFVVVISELIRGEAAAEYSLFIFSIIMILTIRFARGGFMEVSRIVSSYISDRYPVFRGKPT